MAVKKATAKPAKAAKKSVQTAKKPAKAATKPVKVTKKPAKIAAKPAKAAKVDKPTKPARAVKTEKTSAEDAKAADVKKSIAFAKSIAAEMKRSAAEADRARAESEIRLTRRPTTRQQGKESVKFPAADLREFRKRLLEARAKAVSGVDAMRETGFNESDDHEADGGDGTNQTLRLLALGQMGNINRTIQQIEEALHRIDDGTYGICTACGQLIRKQRLQNQPFVLTCMECQSEMERSRR